MTSHRYTPPGSSGTGTLTVTVANEEPGDCEDQGPDPCLSIQELIDRIFSIPPSLKTGVNASVTISALNAQLKAAVKIAVEAELQKPAVQTLLSRIKLKYPTAQFRGVSAGNNLFLTIARVGAH